MNDIFAASDPVPDSPGLWGDALPSAPAAPAYRVLARAYRPQSFAELIGQDALVRTVTNAIRTKRLPQAWMLTGVRGVGKTTTARIIARALNCVGPDGQGAETAEPCGICDTCRAIAEDRHVDVQELDAASRTGVDDIRDIIDGVRYGPASARYKIYILDEVHMLSKNAFNALLKTLEEPPPHVKFIFATTEIRKVPITVLSRCQRFDLRRIDSEALAAHFTTIAGKEGAAAEDEAIRLIARAADGSVRDGLSLLDQAIARGGGTVTTADVKDMLGLADRAQSMALTRQILTGAMAEALSTLDAMQASGTDPLQIMQDVAELIHMLTRARIAPETAATRDALPEAERALIAALADLGIPALTRAWQILLKGIQEIQSAPRPAEAAEMALIRLAYAAELPPPGDLVKRLRETATALPSAAGGSSASTPPPSNQPSATVTPLRRVAQGGAMPVAAPQAAPLQAPVPPPAAQLSPDPASFRELAALFAARREGRLYVALYANAHCVRFEVGLIEIRLDPHVPADVPSRVMAFLSAWTGRRWMVVSVSDAAGEATLAEQDRALEQARLDRAKAHPLMQSVMATFPDAELKGLRQKTVDAPAATDEDAAAPRGDARAANEAHTHDDPEDHEEEP